jgi:hypothetical protein
MVIKKSLKNNIFIKIFLFVLINKCFFVFGSSQDSSVNTNNYKTARTQLYVKKELKLSLGFFEIFFINSWVFWYMYFGKNFNGTINYDDQDFVNKFSTSLKVLMAISLVSVGFKNFFGESNNQAIEEEEIAQKISFVKSIFKWIPMALVGSSLGYQFLRGSIKKEEITVLLLFCAPLILVLEMMTPYNLFVKTAFGLTIALLNFNSFQCLKTSNKDIFKFTKANHENIKLLFNLFFILFFFLKTYQSIVFFLPSKHKFYVQIPLIVLYFVVNFFQNSYIKQDSNNQSEIINPIKYIYSIFFNLLLINMIYNYVIESNENFLKFTQTITKNTLNYKSLYNFLKSNIVLDKIIILFTMNMEESLKRIKNDNTTPSLAGWRPLFLAIFQWIKYSLILVNYILLSFVPIIGFNLYLINNIWKYKNSQKVFNEHLKTLNLKSIAIESKATKRLLKIDQWFLALQIVFIGFNIITSSSWQITVFNLNNLSFMILMYIFFLKKDHLINEINFEYLSSLTVDLRKNKKSLGDIQQDLVFFKEVLNFMYVNQEKKEIVDVINPILIKEAIV